MARRKATADAESGTALATLERDVASSSILDERMTVREFAIADLCPSPDNPKDRWFKPDPDLVASIASLGLINPPTITADGQVLTGHRRICALRKLGRTTVEARVPAAGVEKALQFLLAENGQRVDVDALVESEHVAKLLQAGYTVDAAAAELGRSRGWVARRANLRALGKDARKARADPTHEMSRWPIAWLEELALVNPEAQKSICDDAMYGDVINLEDLRQKTRRQHLPLADARWDLTDPSLVAKAGACSLCPKNTAAQPGLYDDEKPGSGGSCRDSACFETKHIAWIGVEHAIAEEKHGCKLAVAVKGGLDPADVAKATGAAVVDEYSVTRVAKTKPGAVPVFGVDGKVFHVAAEKPGSKSASSSRGSVGGAPVKAKSLAVKVAELEGRRQKAVVLVLIDQVEGWLKAKALPWLPVDDEHVLQLVGAYGTGDHDAKLLRRTASEAEWTMPERLRASTHGDERRELLARSVLEGFIGKKYPSRGLYTIRYATGTSQKIKRLAAEVHTFCILARWEGELSYEGRMAAAVLGLPRPKSWPAEKAAPAKPAAKAKQKGKR